MAHNAPSLARESPGAATALRDCSTEPSKLVTQPGAWNSERDYMQNRNSARGLRAPHRHTHQPLTEHRAGLAMIRRAVRSHVKAHGKQPVIVWLSPALDDAVRAILPRSIPAGRAPSLGSGFATRTTLSEDSYAEDLPIEAPSQAQRSTRRLR